jgi:hypothetical protein
MTGNIFHVILRHQHALHPKLNKHNSSISSHVLLSSSSFPLIHCPSPGELLGFIIAGNITTVLWSFFTFGFKILGIFYQ